MKTKRIGIIGGLGAETSCKFLLSLNNSFRKLTSRQPDIVMENLPVSIEAEKRIIKGNFSEEHLNLLKKAVLRLNQANVDFIAIPCNTVHIFIDDLRKISEKPILSIIEESVNKCNIKGIKKVGLLATSTTIDNEIFTQKFKESNIETVIPSKEDQEKLDNVILRLVNREFREENHFALFRIIKDLKERGAEKILLGCTDLQFLADKNNSLMDTFSILLDSTSGVM